MKNITKVSSDNGSGGASLSYCQLLSQQAAKCSPSDPALVGTANIFISHAWMYCTTSTSSEVKFKDRPDVFLWIDFFSHTHHEERTSDEWITQFEQRIVRIRNTVMIETTTP
eukprot:gene32729-42382_t